MADITIDDLRDEWLRTHEQVTQMIEFLDKGNRISTVGKDPEVATREWKEKLVSWRVDLEQLLDQFPASQ